MATKPERILKKLKTLARTQKRLLDWARHEKVDAWNLAKGKIYKRAQEASRIVREKNWTSRFTTKERAAIKRTLQQIRENVLRLYRELDTILIGKNKKRKRSKKPGSRTRSN